MCGIAGVFVDTANSTEAPKIASYILFSLQHRGQEGVGLATSDGNSIKWAKTIGLVSDAISNPNFQSLKGRICIGHIRYSTTGKTDIKNLQPIVVDGMNLKFSIAHNGNIVNFSTLREQLEERGSVFSSEMDTELIAHLIASAKGDIIERMKYAFTKIKGSWSLVIMTPKLLIGARDPFGFRPLCLGKMQNTYILASESSSFDVVGAEFIREVEPGEIVSISEKGLQSYIYEKQLETKKCIFEHIYFSRPDSHIFGKDVYLMRINLGIELAEEHPSDADIVIPVPDSGLFAALGYSQKSAIPLSYGLIRSHYTGRTFIEPLSSTRKLDVRMKLNPVKSLVRGKRIVLVDDSIVRGTTSQKIVKMLFDSGAKEVHMRISSPPIKFPCFYGIDTPSKGELIASSFGIEEVRKFLGCSSLAYLSIEGMLKACRGDRKEFCTACFSGDYPIHPEDSAFITQLRLFREF